MNRSYLISILFTVIISVTYIDAKKRNDCYRRLIGPFGEIKYPDHRARETKLPRIYKRKVFVECVYFTSIRRQLVLDFEKISPASSKIYIEVNKAPHFKWIELNHTEGNSSKFLLQGKQLVRIVFYRSPFPGISFVLRYSTPKSEYISKEALVKGQSLPDCFCSNWTFTKWTKCSASCGGGIKTRLLDCAHKRNVSCYQKPEKEPCNVDKCPVSCYLELKGVGEVDGFEGVSGGSFPPIIDFGFGRNVGCVFYGWVGHDQVVDIYLDHLEFPNLPALIEFLHPGGIKWELEATIGGHFDSSSCKARILINGPGRYRLVFPDNTEKVEFRYSYHKSEVGHIMRSPSHRDEECSGLSNNTIKLECDKVEKSQYCRFQCATGYVPLYIDTEIYPTFEAECREVWEDQKVWLPAVDKAACVSIEEIKRDCFFDEESLYSNECKFSKEALLLWFDGYKEDEDSHFFGGEIFVTDLLFPKDPQIEIIKFQCIVVPVPTLPIVGLKALCKAECGKNCATRVRWQACMLCQLSKASPCKKTALSPG